MRYVLALVATLVCLPALAHASVRHMKVVDGEVSTAPSSANLFQTKFLTGNVGSAANGQDLIQFTGLTIGKTYTIAGKVALFLNSASATFGFEETIFGANGATFFEVTASSNEERVVGVHAVFVAAETTLTIESKQVHSAAAIYFGTSGGNERTWFTLIEHNDMQPTSKW